MTTMGDALRSAGIEPASERLRQIAVDALARNPRSTDGARDAVVSAVSRDAALIWEVCREYRMRAVDDLLRATAEAVRREAREGAGCRMPEMAIGAVPPRDLSAGDGGAGGRWQDAQQGHAGCAPSNSSGDGMAADSMPVRAASALPYRSPDTKPVPVVAHSRNRPGEARPTAARGAPQLATLGRVAERSAQMFYRGGKLETLINGRPLGDQTPTELRPWIASQRHQARWVEMAIAGIPETSPVRQFRKAEEMDALHLEAEDARDVA